MIKLSEYAIKKGIAYQTAWRHFKNGKIPYPTEQLPSGTVLVDYEGSRPAQTERRAATYSRVSSAENKSNLDRQSERLEGYAMAKGYTITHVVKEIGSGLNDNRRKLEKLLTQDDYDILIVEREESLSESKNALRILKLLLNCCQIILEVVIQCQPK